MVSGRDFDGGALGSGPVDPSLANALPVGSGRRRSAPDFREVAERIGAGVDDITCLAANENPLGPSEAAVEAALAALRDGHRYPDGEGVRLRKALASLHRVFPEQIVLGNGSSELIDLLVRTFVRPGQTVVSAWPSYAAYRIAAQSNNREFLNAPLRKDRYDLAGLAGLVDQRTKLVFIANPNNPTGTYVTLREMAAFLNRVPRETIVVLDEAYADYVDVEDYPDGISQLLPGFPRLVVLRTFSKAYGLAGFRIGFGVMAANMVKYLDAVRQVYNVNAIAQIAALAALDDEAHVARSRRHVSRERKVLFEGLQKLGLQPIPSQTNFLCVRGVPNGFALVLEHQGILVRDMRAYQMQNCVRISVGSHEANQRVLETIARLLKSID